MKAIEINNNVPKDKRGQNQNIKFHVVDKEIMNACGFGLTYGEWIMCIGLTDTISFNLKISDDEEIGIINILDDDFLQPYDFQGMILDKGDKAPSLAKKVQNKVYMIKNDDSNLEYAVGSFENNNFNIKYIELK